MDDSLSFPAPARQRGAAPTLIIIALAVVIALLIGGIGAYFMFSGSESDPAEQAEAHKQPPPEPTFVTVKPMTVNLDGDSRVLYIGLSLNVANDKTAEQLESHMPEVRNRMLIELSDHKAQTLTSSQGKQDIAETLRETLRKPYSPEADPAEINQVLFTNFIVQ